MASFSVDDPPKPFRGGSPPLPHRHAETPDFVVHEIGVDECGRGPLFGRLYAAAVVLPREGGFAYHLMRDSKKIASRARRAEIAQYIRKHALAYSIQYVDNDVIDRTNILRANMHAMHAGVRDVLGQLARVGKTTRVAPLTPGRSSEHIASMLRTDPCIILVDGNYFKPFSVYDDSCDELRYVSHTLIEGGDGAHAAIAAASILAKDAHDTWIEGLCDQYPALEERYGMRSHVGYGTARHLEGIAAHGITQWHRRSFGPCKTAPLSVLTSKQPSKQQETDAVTYKLP